MDGFAAANLCVPRRSPAAAGRRRGLCPLSSVLCPLLLRCYPACGGIGMERTMIAKFEPRIFILALRDSVALVGAEILPGIVARDCQKSPSSPFPMLHEDVA